MREIKFRGETFDGRLIYGNLLCTNNGVYINEVCGEFKVRPETVAQFVFRNIFNKEFYEGDTFVDGGTIYRVELRKDLIVESN